MGKLFGTDGVRGVANIELTAELAYKIGRAGAYVLAGETHHKPTIFVGKDTRISCDMLEAALIAGICSQGADVYQLGIIPTPAVAYLTRKCKADAGVVISASHNPFEFNGIKYFNKEGFKLSDEIEEKIEEIILGHREIPDVTGEQIGRCYIKNTAEDDYKEFLKSTINYRLDGIKVAIDCSNGAAYSVAPKVFTELGAQTFVINNTPSGTNINKGCGSTHIEGLQKYIAEVGADIGFAFDGDADRVLSVDECGNLIDGDKMMAICGLFLKMQNKLPNNTIVATIMSNLGLDVMAKKNDLKIAKTKVGDRYVIEEMKDKGYLLGGEQSGHVIFLDFNTTGDGLVSALQLLNVVVNSKSKASHLASIMDVYPQVLVNAKVSNEKKKMYMEDMIIAGKVKELENEFSGEGRVLIRPSGTEPLVRVMIEGKDKEYLQQRAFELAKIIEERLG